MRGVRGLLFVAAWLVALAGCSSGGGGDSPAATTGCAWHGNCSTRAKEGSYDCSGNTLMRCQAGQWIVIRSCTSLTYTSSSGFSYACTCKGGCGTSTVECSYAFNICGGQSYTQP